MKPVMMSVADHAYLDPTTGKLYVLGTFTHISFDEKSEFPLTHHAMTFVVKIISEQLSLNTSEDVKLINDIGTHHLSIALVNDDGREIARLETPFVINQRNDGLPSEVNFIWQLKNISFPTEGNYEFTVDVDHKYIGNTYLLIAKRSVKE